MHEQRHGGGGGGGGERCNRMNSITVLSLHHSSDCINNIREYLQYRCVIRTNHLSAFANEVE